jgi:predicted tellurium resistance membrane protein TerC
VAELFTFDHFIALATLTLLEIVLGIDNIVFLAILSGKLPKEQQGKARQIGLLLAMGMRILLLMAIGWVMSLKTALFSVPQFWTGNISKMHEITGRDLIMLAGGLFLIAKATYEIHDKLEGHEHHTGTRKAPHSFVAVIIQIVLIDIVFSLDSVITAIGMVKTKPDQAWMGLTIMITAVMISIGVMLAFAGPIANFVERHPTMKMLALSFLILIGVMLVVEGVDMHVPRGYVYFAMAFSLGVEFLNMRMRRVSEPVKLHQTYVDEEGGAAKP